MCIYCGTKHYRKIYQNHVGPIPKDETGRTYEIHHIDGDRENNDPNNLLCVSIKEHYDIHETQGDWGACLKIGSMMKLPHAKLSELSRAAQLKRVADGTHHLLSGEIQRKSSKERLEAGTHNFIRPWTCEHCGKEGKGTGYSRYHVDKCRSRLKPTSFLVCTSFQSSPETLASSSLDSSHHHNQRNTYPIDNYNV